MRGDKFEVPTGMVMEDCCECGIRFAMPAEFQQQRLKNRGTNQKWFYCPAGHAQFYLGKTDVQILREQVDQIAEQRDSARRRESRLREKWAHERAVAAGHKGYAAKLRKKLKEKEDG